MKIPATIYGSPDEEQEILIDFEFYKIPKWFSGRSNHFVNYCKVLTPINFMPSDLETDISIAIAMFLNVYEGDVKIECEIEDNQKMFI